MTTEHTLPEGWRPEEGETLAGTVVGLDKGWSDYGSRFYPIVTLRKQDGSLVNVHCFQTVLERRMMGLAPRSGDKLSITYHGKKDTKDGRRTVAVYSVESNRKQDAESFWKGLGADTPPAAADVPADDDGDLPF